MIRKEHAFTLVELMIALALSGIAMAGIYKAFSAQQKVFVVQDQSIGLQADLRTTMDMIVSEIRMAGYCASSLPNDTFGFVNDAATKRYTTATSIAFTEDVLSTGTNGQIDNSDREEVAFRLNVAPGSGNDLALADRDGVLRKYSPGGITWQPFAENIEAIGFAYAYDDGKGHLATAGNPTGTIWAIDTNSPPDGKLDRNLDTNNDGEVDALDAPAGVAITSVDINRIRAVRIWILARSKYPDKEYTDTATYVVSNQRLGPFNDNFRRRLVVSTAWCRNMGLVK